MAAKKIGISLDLIIHPGETISDVLEERGITQAELAARTGVSPAFVSNVIAGNKDISADFAMALEYALGVPKSFWLNLQANYTAELLEAKESLTITDEEYDVFAKFSEIVAFLKEQSLIPSGGNRESEILALRKVLQISNIANLENLVPAGAFRMATTNAVDKHILGAWLRICQMMCEDIEVSTEYDPGKIQSLVCELKQIMLKKDCDLQKELKATMARYGIAFSVVKNFKGAPVHGYISQRKDGVYQMAVTARGAFADIFWFSLFHEIGHIVNGDISRTLKFIDMEEVRDENRESAANKFAQDMLLEPHSYATFIKDDDFSINAIKKYAASQNVEPYIIIGRLQKEKCIPYAWYSDYKERYKW